MCGRYYIDEVTLKEMEKIVYGIDTEMRRKIQGDVHPSEQAVVVCGKGKRLYAEKMFWGFLQYRQTGLLINARAETALERKTFRESILHRRCVIPARHFYEWDAEKNKVSFERNDRSALYMAGFYNRFSDGDHFVILTTKANASVCRIHDRMPLILEEKELERWVYDDQFLEAALQKIPCQLEGYQEYEQQTLF